MRAKDRDKEGGKATYGDGDVSGDYFKSGINGFNATLFKAWVSDRNISCR